MKHGKSWDYNGINHRIKYQLVQDFFCPQCQLALTTIYSHAGRWLFNKNDFQNVSNINCWRCVESYVINPLPLTINTPQCRNAVDLFMVSNRQGSDLWRVQLTRPGDETNKNADFWSPKSWGKISRFLGPAWKILEIVPRCQQNPGDWKLVGGWKTPLKNVPNHKPESHRKSLEKNAGHATQGHHIGQRTFIRTFQGVSEFIGL